MSSLCLESQGSPLIPLYYLLSCSSAESCNSFCLIFFSANSSAFLAKRQAFSVFTLLYLSVVFDTIDQDLLLNHLRGVFGSYDAAVTFFGSHLSGKKQIVSVLGCESKPSSLLVWCSSGLSTRPNPFHFIHSLCQISLNIILFYITCLLMTLSCTTQFPVPTLILFSATCKTV